MFKLCNNITAIFLSNCNSRSSAQPKLHSSTLFKLHQNLQFLSQIKNGKKFNLKNNFATGKDKAKEAWNGPLIKLEEIGDVCGMGR